MTGFPQYGILSKQIVRSPVIKVILPAKVRSGKDVDLVFVHETYLEVFEINTESKLNRIGLLDFDYKIEAAAVMDMTTNPVKQERSDDDIDQLPNALADVVVLKVDCHQVIFVHCETGPAGLLFRTTTMPLPALPPSKYGVPTGPSDLLAVDPRGSAIAVAGLNCGIVLYSHPCTTQFQDAILPLPPRLAIIKMTFLHPPPADEHRTDLLVLGVQDRKLVIYVYDCDAFPPRGNSPRRHALGKEHIGLPMLLIPLKLPGAFIIVDENIMAIYQYGYDGSIRQMECLPLPRLGQGDGTSLGRPLWTTWVRSWTKHTLANSSEDAICLAREDGQLLYMRINKIRDKISPSTEGAIKTGLKIDQAFAAVTKTGVENTQDRDLLLDEQFNIDLLAIGGCGCDGGIYSVQHYPDDLSFHKIGILPNWAPLIDTALTPITTSSQQLSISAQTDAAKTSSHDALFITSGSGQSQVATFEHCSTLSHSPVYSFTDFRDVLDDLCVLEDNHDENGNTTMLCSQPWGSLLVHNTPEMQYHVRLGDERTLLAFALTDENAGLKYFIQATPTKLLVFDIDLLLTEDALEAAIVDQEPLYIRCTAYQYPYIALAVSDDSGAHVHLRKVSQLGQVSIKQLEGAAFSGGDVTCMTFTNNAGAQNDVDNDIIVQENGRANETFLVIGTNDGRVLVYLVDTTDGMNRQANLEIPLGKPIDSIVCLTSAYHSSESLILCGLRTGQIYTIPVSAQAGNDSNHITVQQTRPGHKISLGSTSVKLLEDKRDLMNAYAMCDNQLSRITWTQGPADQLLMQKIRSSNTSEMTCARLYTACSVADKADYLAIASSDGIHFGHLRSDDPLWCLRIAEPSSIPNAGNDAAGVDAKQNIAYNPQRVHYLPELSALIVASTSFELDPLTKTRYAGSTIHINQHVVNPLVKLEHRIEPGMWHSIPNERLTCMLPWKWPRSHSHMLIAGFKVTGDDGLEKGVIKYFKVSTITDSNEMHHYKISVLHSSHESSPVYSLAQAGVFLVIGVGAKLRIRPFDRAQKKFLKGSSMTLPSAAVLATVSNPEDFTEEANERRRIYITTSAHSFMIFAFQDKQSQHLHLLASAPRADDGISHLVLEPEPGTEPPATTDPTNTTLRTLMTTKHNTLHLLTFSPSPSATSPSTLTHQTTITLPTSLTRLHAANLRPFSTVSTSTILGIRTADIYGTAADGSIWSFSILSEEAWYLLTTLERLILRDEAARLTKSGETTALAVAVAGEGAANQAGGLGMDVATEAAQAGGDVGHVRGDVLIRLLQRRDAAAVLADMLARAESAAKTATPLDRLEVLQTHPPGPESAPATGGRIIVGSPTLHIIRWYFLGMLGMGWPSPSSSPEQAQNAEPSNNNANGSTTNSAQDPSGLERLQRLAGREESVLEAVVEWARSVLDVVELV